MVKSLITVALLLIFVVVIVHNEAQKRECVMKRYGQDGENIVCVCNATYCDGFPELETLPPLTVAVYKSSLSGQRFKRTTTTFERLSASKPPKTLKVKINAQINYQSIIGFGGAFTDAVGINLNSLPSAVAEELLRSYFDKNGLQYSLGRVPMASCDFSTHEYSYDDVDGDFALNHFALTDDDKLTKIPYIHRAIQLTNGTLKLIASPWSAPGWMKTNGHMKGGGRLKGDENSPYHITWANYFVRFLESYYAQGIKFWGLTIQNEPSTGSYPAYSWQTMFFNSKTERNFVRNHLGPTLRNSTIAKDVAIMIMDDQRFFLPYWADEVLADDVAEKYVSGIAVHWYGDYPFVKASLLSETHRRHPNKFILSTEASNGVFGIVHGPILGDWYRADFYAHDIIDDLLNWVSGWVDWNLCLDLEGGPNWVSNFLDSAIIVNATAGEFYKQPMFYIMGHFSKFIRPGSQRIAMTISDHGNDFEGVALKTPSYQRVLIVNNRNDQTPYTLTIEDAAINGMAANIVIEPRTIATIVWNKQ